MLKKPSDFNEFKFILTVYSEYIGHDLTVNLVNKMHSRAIFGFKRKNYFLKWYSILMITSLNNYDVSIESIFKIKKATLIAFRHERKFYEKC